MSKVYALILSLFLAFAPPFAFALAGTEFDAFRHLSNAARTADGGLSANYHFLNTKNVAKVAKNYKVTAKQLARIYKKRRFCVVGGFWTVALCSAVMYMGTDYITDLLIGDGWTVDEKEGKIYKNVPSDGIILHYDSPVYKNCSSLNVIQPTIDCISNQLSDTYSQTITRTEIEKVLDARIQDLYDRLSAGTLQLPVDDQIIPFSRVKTWYYYSPDGVGESRYETIVNINYTNATGTSEKLITDDELADYVKKAPDDDVIALATSPDYAAEGHEPTIKAAEVAVPEADAPPDEDPTTDDPTTDPSTDPAEQPAFCDYAKKLCDWLDWTMEEPENPADNDVTVDEQVPLQRPQDFDKAYVTFAASCPPVSVASFSMFGQSVNIEFATQPFCDFAPIAKPVILGVAALGCVAIITPAIRGAA